VDVRAASVTEQQRVDAALRRLSAVLPGAAVVAEPGPTCPPMEPAASAGLFATAQRVAALLGLEPLRGVAVGGASDGNRTAGVGTPTLDGLGAVGGGPHADREHVNTALMPERTALLAALVAELLGSGGAT
jgi:glutamate carboxypeptidase